MSADQQKLNQLFWGRVQIEDIRSLMIYQKGNKVKDVLQQLKYQNKTKLAQHLGKLLGEQLSTEQIYQAIIPIPLHPKKLKLRGFNQSKVIADGIKEVLDVPIQNNWIRRIHHNPSQTKVSKYERWNNVRSIFEVPKPEKFKNKHVLVIDDVLTTGATLEACVALLNKIEGCKVSVATLAARV
jgi:ComF family protein